MNAVLKHIYGKWSPHDGQLKAGRLFMKGGKDTFLQCGRKWGKTEFILWAIYYHASNTPNAVIYYVCPDIRKAERILWHNNRIQKFGPDWFVKKVDSENKIVHFVNDGHVQLLSSRDHGNASGLSPTLIILDEISDHNENFYREFEPNRAVHYCQAVFIGTPPLYYSKNKEQYYEIRDKVISSEDGFFLRSSSYENPHNSKKFLDKIRTDMYNRGEGKLFEIQYMAKDALFVEDQLFPMLEESVLKTKKQILDTIGNDYQYLEWYGAIKPTVERKSGLVLVGINPRDGHLYVFFTHTEEDPRLNSTSKLVPVIQRMNGWKNLDDIFISCTPKASWFSTDLAQNHSIHCIPADPASVSHSAGISMIRDLLLNNSITICSENAEGFYKELYVANVTKDGRSNEKQFLLIDCLRYILHSSGYTSIGQRIHEGPSLPRNLFDLTDPT